MKKASMSALNMTRYNFGLINNIQNSHLEITNKQMLADWKHKCSVLYEKPSLWGHIQYKNLNFSILVLLKEASDKLYSISNFNNEEN